MIISISTNSPPLIFRTTSPTSLTHFTPSLIYFKPTTHFRALKTGSDGDKVVKQDPFGPDLLKKPVISALDVGDVSSINNSDLNEENNESESESESESEEKREDEDWVDWEDQILEDTVPLVGFVRMLLHSGKYGSGDRLSPEHEKTVLERLLPYHPEFEKKIGCGVDYIKVDFHPDFVDSRCLFVVRKDGESVDFSYWKCIKGLIKKNYPLYADSFILRHFQRR